MLHILQKFSNLVLELKNKPIDIIKLGGSIITNKNEYRSLRKKQLSHINTEIAHWDKQSIIIHGAGSFGHIIANRYLIQLGYNSLYQLKGVIQIRRDMTKLTDAVIKSLVDLGVSALAFQTSAMVFEKNNEYSLCINPLRKALELGFIPVLSGDVVFTENKGFKIISGDAVANLIAKQMEINRVIFISNVDGLYLKNKDTQKDELANYLTTAELANIEISDFKIEDSEDVTGEMQGKLLEIKQLLKYVPEVIIVNGFYPERLASLRKGENYIGTRIVSKNSTQR